MSKGIGCFNFGWLLESLQEEGIIIAPPVVLVTDSSTSIKGGFGA